MASYQVQRASTAYPLVFFMTSSSDHLSAKTGASPTVTLSKAGAAFAAPAGAVTEIGSGWYQVAGNATDTGTLGPLLLHATASGADDTDVLYEVVPNAPGALAASGLDAVAIEGFTLPQALSLMAAVLCGKLSGAEGTTVAFAAAGGSAARVVAVADASGNRTSVTLSPP